MGNREINNKRNTLRVLKDLNGDLTISQLRELFETAISQYDDMIARQEQKVIDVYTDIYLVKQEKHDLFGLSMTAIHITSIKAESYYDDGSRRYVCKGKEVHVSKHNAYIRELDKSFSQDGLENFTEIIDEDFNHIIDKVNVVQDKIDAIINLDI